MQINEGRFTKKSQTTGGVVWTHLNKCWSNWKSSPSKGGHKTYSKQNHHPHYINFLFDCCHTQGDIHGMFILVDSYRLLMPLALLYNTNTQVLNMESKFQAPPVIPLKLDPLFSGFHIHEKTAWDLHHVIGRWYWTPGVDCWLATFSPSLVRPLVRDVRVQRGRSLGVFCCFDQITERTFAALITITAIMPVICRNRVQKHWTTMSSRWFTMTFWTPKNQSSFFSKNSRFFTMPKRLQWICRMFVCFGLNIFAFLILFLIVQNDSYIYIYICTYILT